MKKRKNEWKREKTNEKEKKQMKKRKNKWKREKTLHTEDTTIANEKEKKRMKEKKRYIQKTPQ